MSKRLKNLIYPHFSDGRFYNYPGEKRENIILPSLGMLFKSFFNRLSKSKFDFSSWLDVAPVLSRSQDLVITWVGHSTFLIQVNGINILTDPVFGNLSLLFPRIMRPGINLNELPEIDFVIVSHNHRDHMDAACLKVLKNHKNISILVGKGDKAWFDSRGFENVSEHMWWDQKRFARNSFSSDIQFTFLPSYHWSQRGLFDYNKSLWGSWMIQVGDKTIYFAGDTAYSSHFKYIADEFRSIDIAIMPIGPCEPNRLMQDSHISAEQAGQAFLDLEASHFIPMHWGTYYFGLDSFIAPYERIVKWWQGQNFDLAKTFHTFKIGERKQINVFEPQVQVDQNKLLEL